jgi:hypothetical protein
MKREFDDINAGLGSAHAIHKKVTEMIYCLQGFTQKGIFSFLVKIKGLALTF